MPCGASSAPLHVQALTLGALACVAVAEHYDHKSTTSEVLAFVNFSCQRAYSHCLGSGQSSLYALRGRGVSKFTLRSHGGQLAGSYQQRSAIVFVCTELLFVDAQEFPQASETAGGHSGGA